MDYSQNEENRRSAIAWAIALTADTLLEPEQYEIELLAQYAKGALTLSQVLASIDTRVRHVLYRSTATALFTSKQLTDLLEESRRWNEKNGITGLLCYSDDGHFVQIIEGPAANVKLLFNNIQGDSRHHQVIALSERASNRRWFAEWQMALLELKSNDFFWLTGYLEARGHNLVLPQIPINEPMLKTLLEEFGKF